MAKNQALQINKTRFFVRSSTKSPHNRTQLVLWLESLGVSRKRWSLFLEDASSCADKSFTLWCFHYQNRTIQIF